MSLPSSTRKSTFQSRNGCSIERLDPEPGVDQRGDDLAQAVVPAVLGQVADVGVGSAYEPLTANVSGSACSQYG